MIDEIRNELQGYYENHYFQLSVPMRFDVFHNDDVTLEMLGTRIAFPKFN